MRRCAFLCKREWSGGHTSRAARSVLSTSRSSLLRPSSRLKLSRNDEGPAGQNTTPVVVPSRSVTNLCIAPQRRSCAPACFFFFVFFFSSRTGTPTSPLPAVSVCYRPLSYRSPFGFGASISLTRIQTRQPAEFWKLHLLPIPRLQVCNALLCTIPFPAFVRPAPWTACWSARLCWAVGRRTRRDRPLPRTM